MRALTLYPAFLCRALWQDRDVGAIRRRACFDTAAVFFAYNVAGTALRTGRLLLAGYLRGRIPWVERNLTAELLGILALSVLQELIGWTRPRLGHCSSS